MTIASGVVATTGSATGGVTTGSTTGGVTTAGLTACDAGTFLTSTTGSTFGFTSGCFPPKRFASTTMVLSW